MAESKRSTIDKKWQVLVFRKTDKDYPAILFEIYGIALADLGSKSIFIDGEALVKLTHNHQLAIEAHEIAHGRLKHDVREIENIDQEMEADWLAHRILMAMNLVTPATILSQRYIDHYGQEINTLDERMGPVLAQLGIE